VVAIKILRKFKFFGAPASLPDSGLSSRLAKNGSTKKIAIHQTTKNIKIKSTKILSIVNSVVDWVYYCYINQITTPYNELK
jgi:hypothetical protein